MKNFSFSTLDAILIRYVSIVHQVSKTLFHPDRVSSLSLFRSYGRRITSYLRYLLSQSLRYPPSSLFRNVRWHSDDPEEIYSTLLWPERRLLTVLVNCKYNFLWCRVKFHICNKVCTFYTFFFPVSRWRKCPLINIG